MKKKKKGGGGELNRSEIVQARLSPKIKFLSEIAGLQDKRTLSSLIEAALEMYLKATRFCLHDQSEEYRVVSYEEFLDVIWDPDEVVRLARLGLYATEHLSPRQQDQWYYICGEPYFWKHYEVKYVDTAGKVLTKDWVRYDSFEGLIIEHVKEYWYEISTEEGRYNANVPDKIGKMIDAPPDVETEEIIAQNEPETFLEGTEDDIERLNIWRDNIHKLIRKEIVTIQTPNGPQTKVLHEYPDSLEQREMVERLYKEKIKCRSGS